VWSSLNGSETTDKMMIGDRDKSNGQQGTNLQSIRINEFICSNNDKRALNESRLRRGEIFHEVLK